MVSARLLPELDQLNRPFWTAGEDGRLMIARCPDCDLRIHPPQPVCRRCLSRIVTPEPASGRGTVYSFTINHQAWLPEMTVPFVLAFVDLDDQPGVRLATNIVGCPIGEVRIGLAVKVVFERHDDVWLPLFRPDDRRDGAG